MLELLLDVIALKIHENVFVLLRIWVRQIKSILIEICNIQINDNIDMSFESIDELDHTHINYPGYRIKLNTRYGKMRCL